MSDLAHKLIKVSTEVKSKAFFPEVCNQTNHPLVDIIKNADLRYLCITVTFQTQKLCPSLLLSLLLHIPVATNRYFISKSVFQRE